MEDRYQWEGVIPIGKRNVANGQASEGNFQWVEAGNPPFKYETGKSEPNTVEFSGFETAPFEVRGKDISDVEEPKVVDGEEGDNEIEGRRCRAVRRSGKHLPRVPTLAGMPVFESLPAPPGSSTPPTPKEDEEMTPVDLEGKLTVPPLMEIVQGSGLSHGLNIPNNRRSGWL